MKVCQGDDEIGTHLNNRAGRHQYNQLDYIMYNGRWRHTTSDLEIQISDHRPLSTFITIDKEKRPIKLIPTSRNNRWVLKDHS